jgi:hypothetical protein
LLLTIDEFSGLTPDVAQRFVPALHRLGTRQREQIRIVVTTRDPFEAVLASFALNNPNLGDWHTVEVAPFTDAELHQAAGAAGPRARAAAAGRSRRCAGHSGMAPKPAQCLCFNLWKDEQAGKSDAELAARCGPQGELPVSLDNPYRAAGAFRGKAYIRRDADAQLIEQIEDNQYYPYFAAPRQSGQVEPADAHDGGARPGEVPLRAGRPVAVRGQLVRRLLAAVLVRGGAQRQLRPDADRHRGPARRLLDVAPRVQAAARRVHGRDRRAAQRRLSRADF